MAKEKDTEAVVEQDKLKDNPIASIDLPELKDLIEQFYKTEFDGKNSVTKQELQIGAKLARSYGYHARRIPEAPEAQEEEGEVDGIDDEGSVTTPPRQSMIWSVTSVNQLLKEREWKAIEIQHKLGFWKEPKDLLITLIACCMASFTQGWDQVANGNLGWPAEFNISVTDAGVGTDIWAFGGINAVTWFAAAILGPFLVDPICHWKKFGRRGAVFVAALFSFASMIGGSQTTTWQGYLVTRLLLGIGIGAKASIVPIWESEVLPPAKRGRLLVSWQVFTAAGIFAGSIATYIFRDSWRNQVLSGALPALLLLILTYIGCESPRWLILQGDYVKAFETLVRLRKERVLAAEELCYIYFQIQTERALLRGKTPDFKEPERPLGYRKRLSRVVTLARNRRAAIATMIVMISQQLSGINILAFLASIFFSAADLRSTKYQQDDANDSLKVTIGFGAANALFSTLAYFFIEPLPVDYSLDQDFDDIQGLDPAPEPEVLPGNSKKSLLQRLHWLRGRRALLLLSLASGTVMLLVLTVLLTLDRENSAKLPLVVIFVVLFTFCYSPGVGWRAVLVFSGKVGMSWAVFWNFLGAGFLALFVPRGFQWGSSKLFGLFAGFSFLAFILVYFFVPGTDHAISLEEMSKRFNDSLITYGKGKLEALRPGKKRNSSKEKASPVDPLAGTATPELLPASGATAETNGLGLPAPTTAAPKEQGQTTVAQIEEPAPPQVPE